jgi:hypothetical protein
VRSVRRFFARLAHLATRPAQDERLRDEIEEHIVPETAENLELVYPQSRHDARPC